MEYRKLCEICGKKPVAVNYKMHGKIYYRTKCDTCCRKKRGLPAPKPRWMLEGYKKKPHCEKCTKKVEHAGLFKSKKPKVQVNSNAVQSLIGNILINAGKYSE